MTVPEPDPAVAAVTQALIDKGVGTVLRYWANSTGTGTYPPYARELAEVAVAAARPLIAEELHALRTQQNDDTAGRMWNFALDAAQHSITAGPPRPAPTEEMTR